MREFIKDIKENNFDFENVGLTEKEYYNQLDRILNLIWVNEIRHSLPLNDLVIKSHNINKNTIIDFSNHNLPEDMIIRSIFIEDNILNININTSKWFCNEKEKSKYYPGKYEDESIAYLYSEIQLMENFEPIEIVQNKEKLELKITTKQPIQNVHNLDDIFSHMGFSISRFTVKGDSIEYIYLRFDESQVYNRKEVADFQKYKYREAIKNIRDNSRPIKLPSGERASPDIWMFNQCKDELIEKFPKVNINAPYEVEQDEIEVYEIPVENTEDVFITISSLENDNLSTLKEEDVSSVSIQNGYACSKTNTIYVLPKNENIFESIINIDDYMNSYTVTYKNGIVKEFELFNYS